jgi:hypothetical protein
LEAKTFVLEASTLVRDTNAFVLVTVPESLDKVSCCAWSLSLVASPNLTKLSWLSLPALLYTISHKLMLKNKIVSLVIIPCRCSERQVQRSGLTGDFRAEPDNFLLFTQLPSNACGDRLEGFALCTRPRAPQRFSISLQPDAEAFDALSAILSDLQCGIVQSSDLELPTSSSHSTMAKVSDAVQDVLEEVEFVHELLVFGLRASTLVECCDEVFDQETDGDDVPDGSKGDRHRMIDAAVVSFVGVACKYENQQNARSDVLGRSHSPLNLCYDVGDQVWHSPRPKHSLDLSYSASSTYVHALYPAPRRSSKNENNNIPYDH